MAGDTGNHVTAWSVFSVLAGTIISAIVSYVLQRRSFMEAREQKAQDKFEARKTFGLNIFHKMIRIASNIEILKRDIQEIKERVGKEEFDRQPWAFVMPIANIPSRVQFAAEEMTLLMLLDTNLFNDLGCFDEIHNSLLEVFELYRTKRSALTDTLPATMSEAFATETQRAITGTTLFTDVDMKKVMPQIAQLNLLVQGMDERTQKDSKEAWELLDRLRDALNKEFNLHLTMELK